MKTSVSGDLIQNMLLRSRQAYKNKGVEMTEETLRTGLLTPQGCGDTPLDQMWTQETPELQASMDRAKYDMEMTEHIIELFHALPPAA